MAELRRLYRYLTPYWPRVLGALIGIALSSMVTLTLPYAIRILVDSVFVNKDFAELNRISLLLFGLFIIQAFVSFFYRFMLQYVAQRSIADLRLDIHRHLLRLPLRFFTNHRVGDILSRVSNDVTTLQDAMVSAPVGIIRQLLTFGGGIALMLYMNWQLTLIILGLIPPLMLITTYYGKKLKRLSTEVQDRQADATIILEEMLSGVRVVKSFVRERFEEQRYAEAIEAGFERSIRRARESATFIPLITVLGFGAITLLLWFGGRQVINGIISPGELISYLFYMIFVSSPMAQSASLWGRLQEAAGSSKRIFEIIDEEPEHYNQQSTSTNRSHNGTVAQSTALKVGGEVAGNVRFVDVNFHYADNEDKDEDEKPLVLHDICLEARAGEIVALVGYSGGGKTTLVNLIPRFYDPTSGRIEIDGVELREYDLQMLRSQIAIVPQETFLFGGTVRENIAYGRLEASDKEIHDAAEAAFAHEFIEELPKGYDSIVGERGVKLSAGQRQRIAIARALLKDPRILLLDEATSALDTESERWVQAALERLMEGRTSFVIAHRLSTIQRADTIVAIEKGRIVESGSHDQLLAQNGLYKRLYEMQFGEPLRS